MVLPTDCWNWSTGPQGADLLDGWDFISSGFPSPPCVLAWAPDPQSRVITVPTLHQRSPNAAKMRPFLVSTACLKSVHCMRLSLAVLYLLKLLTCLIKYTCHLFLMKIQSLTYVKCNNVFLCKEGSTSLINEGHFFLEVQLPWGLEKCF